MKYKVHNGEMQGKGLKIGIVISRFNSFISRNLLEGAVDCLTRHSVNEQDVEVFYVPGSFEIPQAARKVLQTKKFDGVICLGAVIRGDTPHFDFVASEVSKGIAKLSLDFEQPISFGIITADSTDQAIERAGTKSGNKGYDAAETIIEMVNLYKGMGS